MSALLDFIQHDFLLFDGGTGSMLQTRGLPAGQPPEFWNLTHPEEITALHRAYYEAGSNIVCANTFGCNALKLKNAPYSQQQLIEAAFACARAARASFSDGRQRFIAMDIGPIGKLLQPLGDLPFEQAVQLFGDMAALGEQNGADAILIETISDTYEAKAAVLGAKERTSLPVFVTVTFDGTSRLMTGASPQAAVALLEGLGADVVGLNCGLGPLQMLEPAQEMLRWASRPVMVKPNAGLPRLQDGVTCYDISPARFAEAMRPIVRSGARIVGGCCGTTPEHIRVLAEVLAQETPKPLTVKEDTLISSYTHAVALGERPLLIGERINPTGKPRLKRALREGDWQYVQNEGVRQQDAGAQALDVNMGLPGLNEAAAMEQAVQALQSVSDLPLQIDTADPAAMERGLRCCNGKPLINSVNGKEESLQAVLPLAAKYGGVLIALTLDEQGIPATAEGRMAIARRICARAAAHGIAKKDLLVDPLAMAVSADPTAANTVLETIRLLKAEGFRCSLGVSNISFGLPSRDALNAAFFTLALGAGLDAAILNVHSAPMMQAYHSFWALSGKDTSCASYIEYCAAHPIAAASPAKTEQAAAATVSDHGQDIQHQLLHGLGVAACAGLNALLEAGAEPLSLIDKQVIPALNTAGRAFEKGTLFLPQLLLCAEAATQALELLKGRILQSGQRTAGKGRVILATVQGDIHDIGKNIVKTLLQSYGFSVLDLGRDVPPAVVLQTAQQEEIRLIGLSALMTTTLPAMEETISLLHSHLPNCKVVVGGAVLTQDYAAAIGADHYAQTAMDTVRYAEDFYATPLLRD